MTQQQIVAQIVTSKATNLGPVGAAMVRAGYAIAGAWNVGPYTPANYARRAV